MQCCMDGFLKKDSLLLMIKDYYMNKLFFELIQVALGTRICLSHTPSANEWGELYAMAKKQSLVGVCFAGVQKLATSTGSATEHRQEPPEMLYLTWMGMAAKIQQRNQVVDEQCVDLQKRLSADGLRSSILKGQGVGTLYRVQNCGDSSSAGSDPAHEKTVENLSLLRQSGDIDVYVAGGMEKVLGYCTEKFGKVKWDYINAHAPFYQDTEVEMHWRAQAMTNLFKNKRLQKWLAEHEEEIFNANTSINSAQAPNANDSIVVPSAEFNAFYILLHCYHHMFESGLGLRQLMDYYFVLLSLERECPQINREFDVNTLFAEFGMSKFASGIMWLLEEVFKLERECMICEPDEKEGRFLLNEVMQNGNFGHHDERVKKVGSGKMSELWRNVQHNWHLASHYPSEFLWQPIWLAYHYFWKRTNKNKI